MNHTRAHKYILLTDRTFSFISVLFEATTQPTCPKHSGIILIYFSSCLPNIDDNSALESPKIHANFESISTANSSPNINPNVATIRVGVFLFLMDRLFSAFRPFFLLPRCSYHTIRFATSPPLRTVLPTLNHLLVVLCVIFFFHLPPFFSLILNGKCQGQRNARA